MQTIAEKLKLYKNIFAVDPQIKHFFSSGLYAKQMMLPKGFTAIGHAHNYDHLSILAEGKVILKTDSSEDIIQAPSCINIPKDINHEITALQDSVWFCIHATDEKNEENIDKVLIKDKGV